VATTEARKAQDSRVSLLQQQTPNLVITIYQEQYQPGFEERAVLEDSSQPPMQPLIDFMNPGYEFTAIWAVR